MSWIPTKAYEARAYHDSLTGLIGSEGIDASAWVVWAIGASGSIEPGWGPA